MGRTRCTCFKHFSAIGSVFLISISHLVVFRTSCTYVTPAKRNIRCTPRKCLQIWIHSPDFMILQHIKYMHKNCHRKYGWNFCLLVENNKICPLHGHIIVTRFALRDVPKHSNIALRAPFSLDLALGLIFFAYTEKNSLSNFTQLSIKVGTYRQFRNYLVLLQLLGWQQSHFVFFHDFQSKFINGSDKH